MPGDASGGMDGVALKGLTVDFHEPGFVAQLGGENNQPFWFQMSDEQKQKAGSPWGPANPQALNRYSYVNNNPIKQTDPRGHVGITFYASGLIQATLHLNHDETVALWGFITSEAMSKFTALVGIASLYGGLDAFSIAALAAGAGASVQVVAVIFAFATVGLTAVQIVAILGGIGYVLNEMDSLYGRRGIDINYSSGVGVIITPPTVARQSGMWVARDFMSPAIRCSSVVDCLTKEAKLVGIG